MTIKIYSDRIDIGDFTLFEGNGGLQFDGVARAENFKGGAGTFQGSISGYKAGGSPAVNTIQKFSLVTDGNATDVGDLTQVRGATSGQSSSVYGYSSGGYSPPLSPVSSNVIDKFPFASDTDASDVGNLQTAKYSAAGQSSTTSGYSSGGYSGPPPTFLNIIEKFPFATDTDATDIADLTLGRSGASGQSSATRGYSSGGSTPAISPRTSNRIDKFTFAADANATDVGDLASTGQESVSGQSSTESGYVAGGAIDPGITLNSNSIQKFPFATDTNATDTTDLTQARISAMGVSSTTSGYAAGGEVQPAPNVNVIDKFPFATNSNATDVGDLLAASRGGGSVGRQI